MEYNVNDYEIIYRVRENDDDAYSTVFMKYEPVIKKVVAKYYALVKNLGVDLDDLLQEGRIGLVKALKSFDSDGEALFYTYAVVCIERHLISYCRKITANKNYFLNNSVSDECLMFIGDYSLEPCKYLLRLDEERNFIRSKNLFDFRDSNIFELRYNGFSYKEISLLLDIAPTIVDSRLCKIRRTLQQIRDKF